MHRRSDDHSVIYGMISSHLRRSRYSLAQTAVLAWPPGLGRRGYPRCGAMDASEEPPLEPLARLVLELGAEGRSMLEISERLGVPVDRVRAHTQAAISKLGARSKLEALIIAIRRGVIGPPTG